MRGVLRHEREKNGRTHHTYHETTTGATTERERATNEDHESATATAICIMLPNVTHRAM